MKDLIKKELLEIILTSKFFISLIVLITITSISAYINSEDYVERVDSYKTALTLNDTGLVKVHRMPQVLSILSQGKDKFFGTTASLSYGDINTSTSGYAGSFFGYDKRAKQGKYSFDLATIIKHFLIIIVILFSYDKSLLQNEVK